jgi:hypothetical protein
VSWLELARRELSRPALFDEGVEAARNACVAGASTASAAITAAAYYDNPLTGAGALTACMHRLAGVPLDVEAWRRALEPIPEREGTADAPFTPGFGFVNTDQARAIRQALWALTRSDAGPSGGRRRFWLEHEAVLVPVAGALNVAGLMALACLDHELDVDAAERHFLCFRIETALAEAQAARRRGILAFPFLSQQYHYVGARPPPRTLDPRPLLAQLGLDGRDD